MPREAYSDQVKRDAVAMYEDHSHVSLKVAVKELGTDLGSRGIGWEGVGKQGGKGLDSEQGESGCVRVARTLGKLGTLKEGHKRSQDYKQHKSRISYTLSLTRVLVH